MIVIDKVALRANADSLNAMCNDLIKLLDRPEADKVDDFALLNLAGGILGMAHWLMQSSFSNTPDPEPLKEIQE